MNLNTEKQEAQQLLQAALVTPVQLPDKGAFIWLI